MIKQAIVFAAIVFSLTAHASTPIAIQFDDNVADDLKTQVLTDFTFAQSITSTKQSPLHQEIFGKVDGTNYLAWLQSHVQFFGVDRCGGGGAVACVKPEYANKIWVTGNYIYIDHPQVARLMTIFHEARHTESDHNNWPHAQCPSDFPYRSIWTGKSVAGSYACDDTEYGSYSSASVMLNNISKFCESCTDKVKADAQLYSDDQVKRVVDDQAAARLKQDFAF